MNTQLALLRAVRANPNDDAVRLAYADWLEESGTDPERAEFIRLQIAVDRHNPYRNVNACECDECVQCERRLSQLQQAHEERWMEEALVHLPRARRIVVGDCRWCRGFLESASSQPRKPLRPPTEQEVREREERRAREEREREQRRQRRVLQDLEEKYDRRFMVAYDRLTEAQRSALIARLEQQP